MKINLNSFPGSSDNNYLDKISKNLDGKVAQKSYLGSDDIEAGPYDLDLDIIIRPFGPGNPIQQTQTQPPTDCYQCNESRGSHCMNCF